LRVLAIGINYWPEQTGISVFTTGRCEYLSERGHSVTICTGVPYYPQWRIADSYRTRPFVREQHNGVTILRSWMYVPRRVTSVRRLFHEASFVALSLARALIGWPKPDVIFVVSPPLGLSLTAYILSRLWRVPYVYHVADLQPDAAVDLGMLKPSALTRALYRLEAIAYDNAAMVSTLTEPMREKIIGKDIAKEKVQLFPDWADPALFQIPLREGGKSFRERTGIGARYIVLHAGNMGVKQGLEVVISAAEMSSAMTDMVFLLVGDGAMRPNLEKMARDKGLRNVMFLPLQDNETFHDLLAAADLTLVTQQRVVADIVFPSKVITLLAAGRPVVASLNANSEVARVINEAGAGICVEPENPRALLDTIRSLLADADRRTEMAHRGRAYADARWSRPATLTTFERKLTALVSRN
jgi:colanic acid biosynthesis glycosyl transferase WcaI